MSQHVGPVDLVLPAHNEAETIGRTLAEFDRVVRREQRVALRFVVCEDGSTDGTVGVIEVAARTLPVTLLSGAERKGYSRAVIDGFRATTAPLIAFVDSDGQCDPADFAQLLAALPGHDLVMGYRNPRQDHWSRLLMSALFKGVYRQLFRVPFRDPSCPYLIIRREALQRILSGDVGILKQGFWWEFAARAAGLGLSCVEVPVAHRPRFSGQTQVYRPTKVPGIAYHHLRGLLQLRNELRSLPAPAPVPAVALPLKSQDDFRAAA